MRNITDAYGSSPFGDKNFRVVLGRCFSNDSGSWPKNISIKACRGVWDDGAWDGAFKAGAWNDGA
jgi:hypothetical protein